MLRLILCNYSGASILVKGTGAVAAAAADVHHLKNV